jgi:predicted acetyltransferase/RimJ/RimL family protein N-acetyltransferase
MNPTLLDLPMPITTSRLLIRPPQLGDGIAVNEAILESFDVLHQFMSWAKEKPTIEETEEIVRIAAANWILKKSEEPWLQLFIFDKKTNQFVGGTSFYNIAWDVPSVETGYWIRTSRAHQGLITEAITAITRYAFEHLSVKRITITCDKDNIRSQKIPERLGYCLEATLKSHRKKPVTNEVSDTLVYARYNLSGLPDVSDHTICKNQIDLNKIHLVPASLEDYLVIQNMGRFYVYDMSEYLGKEIGWEMPNNGLYECIDFKKYWEAENAFPFLIHYKNELAGFLIIDKKGSELTIDFNVAQFFILRKFKNKGVGRFVAHQCFNKFRGSWEVMVIPGNEGAYCFWKSIIKKYTANHFIEYTRQVSHLNYSEKNIFKFDSR